MSLLTSETCNNCTVSIYSMDECVTGASASVLYFQRELNLTPKKLIIDLKQSSASIVSSKVGIIRGDISCGFDVQNIANKLLSGGKAVFPKFKGTGSITIVPEITEYMIVKKPNNIDLIVEPEYLVCFTGSISVSAKINKVSVGLFGGEGASSQVLKGEGILVFKIPVKENSLDVLTIRNDKLLLVNSEVIFYDSNLKYSVTPLFNSFGKGSIMAKKFQGTGKVITYDKIIAGGDTIAENKKSRIRYFNR